VTAPCRMLQLSGQRYMRLQLCKPVGHDCSTRLHARPQKHGAWLADAWNTVTEPWSATCTLAHTPALAALLSACRARAVLWIYPLSWCIATARECLHDTPANRCSLAFVLRHYCFWALNPTKVSAVLAWTGKHCRGGHMRDKLEAHLTEACEALRTSGGYYVSALTGSQDHDAATML